MNPMFIAIAAALSIGVALWLGRTLLRGRVPDTETQPHAVNSAVLSDQLAELERDLATQSLSADDYQAAKREIQRRVLDEAGPGADAARYSHGDKRTAIALMVVLPLATILMYIAIGRPAATSSAPPQSPPTMTSADVQNMVQSLAARLADNPDDLEGWLMLARSYRALEMYNGSALAFARAWPIIQTDALALAQYAEMLARDSGQGFTAEPTRLLNESLALDPNQPFTLSLAGSAAVQRGDYQAAIAYWQQLLEQLPPESEVAQAVQEGIDRARHEQGNMNQESRAAPGG